MKKLLALSLIFCSFLSSSCITYSYFNSPTNASANPYHATPLRSDSAKGATYVSGLLTVGAANDYWRDAVRAFNLRIHRSNNLGNFQAYYGANISLGEYNIANYYTREYDSYYLNDTTSYYHQKGGAKFFGYYGINGGINFVVPIKHNKGEWRIFGIEASAQKEFGDYYSYRKNLRDSAADIIFKNNTTGTVGFYTEIIAKTRRNVEFGYKMSYGFMLNPPSNYAHVYETDVFHSPCYFSHALHWTRSRTTFFAQLNIGTRYAGSMQFGVNYKISKKKK